MDTNEMKEKYEKKLEGLSEDEIKNLAVLGLMVASEMSNRIIKIMMEIQNRGTQ